MAPLPDRSRPSLSSTLQRGIAAGATGVTALNAVTYLDMAVRARPSSSAPEEAVEVTAHKAGVEIPGDDERRTNRLQGLGPLIGVATGVVAGGTTAMLQRWRPQMGFPMTALLGGATAFLGANAPMTALGMTDPTEWTASAWLEDIVPHLAYGLAAAAVIQFRD